MDDPLPAPQASPGISTDTWKKIITLAHVDKALAQGRAFYLTYHSHATKDLVLAAYPRFPEFLAEKRDGIPTICGAVTGIATTVRCSTPDCSQPESAENRLHHRR